MLMVQIIRVHLLRGINLHVVIACKSRGITTSNVSYKIQMQHNLTIQLKTQVDPEFVATRWCCTYYVLQVISTNSNSSVY
jgi:hypothetical protein